MTRLRIVILLSSLIAGLLAATGSASASTCLQPSSTRLLSDYGSLPGSGFSAPGSAKLTFAGVVEPGTAILYQYYAAWGDPNTGSGFIHNNLEGYAGSNCVLNQRSHTASFIPYVGTMKVYAYYRPWETNVETLTYLGTFTKTS
ncbi:hypothetical protein ACIGNX_01045 [Actinosynnema sp. NPDC053489]|uniref:hypothetical protein n=1 Tax=Actinosynnema sp. NPDC053489 TaxID=3363916 RepID=UPI0037C85A42